MVGYPSDSLASCFS